jgi:hypothetical protein
MTVRRCSSCAAQVAETAQWCGLCYARLDVQPGPDAHAGLAAETVQATVSVPVAEAEPTADPLDRAPLQLTLLTLPLQGDAPSVEQPQNEQRHSEQGQDTDGGNRTVPTWPCVACGQRVPVELNACPGCGIGFLAQVSQANPVLRVPGVGDVSRFSPPVRLALAGGIGLLLAIVLALILALFS